MPAGGKSIGAPESLFDQCTHSWPGATNSFAACTCSHHAIPCSLCTIIVAQHTELCSMHLLTSCNPMLPLHPPRAEASHIRHSSGRWWRMESRGVDEGGPGEPRGSTNQGGSGSPKNRANNETRQAQTEGEEVGRGSTRKGQERQLQASEGRLEASLKGAPSAGQLVTGALQEGGPVLQRLRDRCAWVGDNRASLSSSTMISLY